MRFCEHCGSLMHKVPGGHLCPKCGHSHLIYADRYHSLKKKETIRVIHTAINVFEEKLDGLFSEVSPNCMMIKELMEKGLLKKKHYTYGILLATMSSFPILSKTCKLPKIIEAVIAKTALITAIKTLDNLNDKYHSPEEAAVSLQTQYAAFTDQSFTLPHSTNETQKGENSTYILADLTKRIITAEKGYDSDIFHLYKKDFKRYFQGQIDSMRQKQALFKDDQLNIKTFLKKINEKAVGSVWFNIDFCFLDVIKQDFQILNEVKKAIDLIFKGCNIYDDVADFEEDLKEGISNSVMFLAKDIGLINDSDPSSCSQITERFGDHQIFERAIRLGDFVFLKGLQHLKKAGNNQLRFDIQALIYNAYILRIFAMRKWLIRNKDFDQLVRLTRIKIPSSLLKYAVYIK